MPTRIISWTAPEVKVSSVISISALAASDGGATVLRWRGARRRASALAIVLSLNSESRKLISFYPFAVLFVVEAGASLVRSRRDWLLLGVIAVLCSKVWMPIGSDLSLPLVGEVSWRLLYDSSMGPWMAMGPYLVQMVLVGIAVGLVCLQFRGRPPGRGLIP